MTLDDFKASAAQSGAPDGIPPALLALWHDMRGDWKEAHRLAQEIDDETGAWVHAYLHRKEGDLANAAYWYRRAHQKVAKDSLTVEWDRIARTLLAAASGR